MYRFLLTLSFSSAQNSQNVELVSRTGQIYHAVVIHGNYAYIAEDGGLTILNISIDSSPQLVGMITLPKAAYGVAVSGNYVYVTSESSGLWIFQYTGRPFTGVSRWKYFE